MTKPSPKKYKSGVKCTWKKSKEGEWLVVDLGGEGSFGVMPKQARDLYNYLKKTYRD